MPPTLSNGMHGSTWVLAVIITMMLPGLSVAQETGRIEGSVVLESTGAPVPGVQVVLHATSRGAITDQDGLFTIERVPAGTHTLTAHFVGYGVDSRQVDVSPGDTVRIRFELREETVRLQDVVVSAIGERQDRSDVPATIGSIDRRVIDRANPTHPSDLMNRIAGVWVNTTSGEGHMTAIRQPLTTEAVYLFLENGVPTRSTGFFNHNALYELNVPMAEGLEVIKGPGTALHGSDAVGAVINLATRRPPEETIASLSVEGGSFGFGRLMIGTGGTYGRHGIRLDLNGTKSDGWRDASRYDRQIGTLTWEIRLPGTSRLTTVASASHVDQEPAGASALSREDYRTRPTLNYAPISYRLVNAVRVSSAYERFTEHSHLQLTPYARFNEMELLPNWSLTYDPVVSSTRNYSVGLLGRYRHDFDWMDSRLIGGVDLEFSPGEHHETSIDPTRDGAHFISFSEGPTIYDYDVSFRKVSPYVHAEAAPVTRLRISAGLRLDVLGYAYDNHLDVATDGLHRRAAGTVKSYVHASPKLGLTYRLGGSSSLFASYAHAFRVPSESQLFRQGSTNNTLALEPVRANNLEAGVRTGIDRWLGTELSVYRMIKTDDIISFARADGVHVVTNAGETSHRGVEATLTLNPLSTLSLLGSYSYALHRFERWRPSSEQDFSGNWMDVAPRTMANVVATIDPPFPMIDHLSIEWSRLGSYWMDPANTVEYAGHNLINLQAQLDLPVGLSITGRLMNLTDIRFADRATYTSFRGEELAPGLPRSLYVGVEYKLGTE